MFWDERGNTACAPIHPNYTGSLNRIGGGGGLRNALQFKKVELGNVCLIGAKDRKTLRSRTVKALSLDDGTAESFLPAKATLSAAKVSGTRHVVYLTGQEPWLVLLQDGRIFPTIYALWNTPQMLPALHIHHPVLAYIMRGAHLMVPGVINWSADFKAGSFAAVTIHGNPHPVAVGICENPLDPKGNLRTTGRALEIVHFLGDGLCKLSPKPFPDQEIKLDQTVVEQELDQPTTSIQQDVQSDINRAEENVGSSQTPDSIVLQNDIAREAGSSAAGNPVATSEHLQEGEVIPEGDTTPIIKGVEELSLQPSSEDKKDSNSEPVTFLVPLVDLVLRICFFQTVHAITDDQLPMEISAMYSHMTADGAKLVSTSAFKRLIKEADMWDDNITQENATNLIAYKKSSFKKLVKMFQTWAKEGLLSMKETRGVATVVNINRSCDKYLKFTPISITKGSDKGSKKTDKIRVRRLLAFSANQRKALAQLGVQVDSKPMTVDQFKQIVIEHISSEGSIILEYIDSATQYHQVVRGEEVSSICKGAAQPVTIAVEPRGSRKHITVVKGLFNYLFNMDENLVAEALRKKFASSVSVNNGIISIQGRVAIKNELTDQFGLPQQHIKLL